MGLTIFGLNGAFTRHSSNASQSILSLKNGWTRMARSPPWAFTQPSRLTGLFVINCKSINRYDVHTIHYLLHPTSSPLMVFDKDSAEAKWFWGSGQWKNVNSIRIYQAAQVQFLFRLQLECYTHTPASLGVVSCIPKYRKMTFLNRTNSCKLQDVCRLKRVPF